MVIQMKINQAYGGKAHAKKLKNENILLYMRKQSRMRISRQNNRM